MVDLLLQLKAKVEPPRPSNRQTQWYNALMAAAQQGDIPLMQQLLNAGADIHAVDSSGQNVIFWAIRSGNLAAVRWLIGKGAYLQLKSPDGLNAVALAAALGKLEILKYLLGTGMTHPNLMDYARRGNQETMEYVAQLENRTRPDDPTRFWNQVDISTDQVRQYIAKKGNVNYSEGCPTPLQQMTWLGNIEAVRLLLENGADPRKRGQLANSAAFLTLSPSIHVNSENGFEMLKLYLAHGVSPDSREYLFGTIEPEISPTGMTLLSEAISNGNFKCARFLLEQGANPLLEYQGKNAYDFLRESKKFPNAERDELRKLMEKRALPAHPDVEAEMLRRATI